MDWTEKYRPRGLKEVVGNPKAVKELKQWAESWEAGNPEKRAVILSGGPGTGKTSSALALARDMGWGVIELNASDARNAEAIRKVATMGALNETFTDDGEFISVRDGGRKLIILDEADNLYERVSNEDGEVDVGDRGGKRAIIDTIEKTAQPIVLIVNDYYELTRDAGAKLANLCQTVKFGKVNKVAARYRLSVIAKTEGVRVSPEALDMIIERSEGDLRSAINDLQSLAQNREAITPKDTSSLGYRDTKKNIFEAVRTIFKTSHAQKATQTVYGLDETPDFVLLWLDENLPVEYKNPDDLVRGYDALSRADVFLGRVSRRQHYGLWGYANDMMTAGIATAKRKRYGGFTPYKFPSWLKKMSRSRQTRYLQRSISGKVGGICHTSSSTAWESMVPTFKFLFSNDREFLVEYGRKLALDPEELAFLLEETVTSHHVKHAMEDIKGEKREQRPEQRQENADRTEDEDRQSKHTEQRDLLSFG